MANITINTISEYREALQQVSKLRDAGEMAETNKELARLEAAIAVYVTAPGKPASSKGRPDDGGTGM